MSAEEGSQPPTAGADKAQAPKPAATFSSFINKNTSGKKFAPKAARRRPGAAAAAAPAPPASAPESTAEPQAEPTEPEAAPAPAAESPTIVQLPTPAATQEPASQHAPQAETPAAETSATVTAPSVERETPSIAIDSIATPAPTNLEIQAPAEDASQTQPHPSVTPQPVDDAPRTERPAKRRRTQPPAKTDTVPTPETRPSTASEDVPSQPAHTEIEPTPALHEPQTTASEQAPPTETEGRDQEDAIDVAPPADGEGTAERSRKRRTLPWVAVNHARGDEEVEGSIAPTRRTRQPAKTRRGTNTTTIADAENADVQESQEENDAQPTPKRPSAKARGKRKADEANADGDFEAGALVKKPRKPRKDKGKKRATDEGAAEGEAEQVVNTTEGGTTTRKPRKPRQPRRKQPIAEGEDAGEGGEEVAPRKRKGRPAREDTPPDAEFQTIDPEVTFMDTLASRNLRVGRISELERKMRNVNWEEVKQKRREEDRRIISTKETRAAADKALAEAGEDAAAQTAEQGPRMRVTADGRIELIHDSGTIDREAQADMQIATMEIHEEADVTAHITSRSFMKNNKRFPNDFLLPGQGHRWTQDQTDLFYKGLSMYGTDFQMISMMFPALTRRSIKTKFTREERDNPDKIARTLLGESEMEAGWGSFLQASELQDDKFADVDKIKREMDAVEADMRRQIDEAKKETEERRRQLKEAGLLPEGEGEKENAKGRKKKGKGKQVTFQQEEGVEILGGLDDDPEWGVEG